MWDVGIIPLVHFKIIRYNICWLWKATIGNGKTSSSKRLLFDDLEQNFEDVTEDHYADEKSFPSHLKCLTDEYFAQISQSHV